MNFTWKDFFSARYVPMKKWLQNIMAGRYGSDELGFTLLLIYLGICIFGIFCDLPLVQLLGLDRKSTRLNSSHAT